MKADDTVLRGMEIGASSSLNLEAVFPAEGPGRPILPDAVGSSLWAAAGGGPCQWYRRQDDPRWGSWTSLLLVDEAPYSQYDRLIEFLRKGGTLPDRVACVAQTGRGFHGQRGRPWSVLRGNLHLVVHLSPLGPAKEIGLGFTLLPAVACVRAIRRLSDGAITAGIKWVNDIVVEHCKVGGFLISTQTQGDIIRDVILGMGINVDAAPEVEPTPFVPAVGCLREFERDISVASLLPALLREIYDLYRLLLADGFRPLLREYRRYATIVGRPVRVWQDTEQGTVDQLRTIPPLARGVVAAIADDLSLIIEGRREPVSRGRLAEEVACLRFGL